MDWIERMDIIIPHDEAYKTDAELANDDFRRESYL
jgi:hypothetical protein